MTINGVGQSSKQGGDGACDDTTSTGLIVPLRLFRNFDRIPDCHVKTPWAFSQQVPAGQPVHVKIQIFDTDAIFDDEADLKVGDGDAIEFDVDPATGKWSGDINWPQNCSRPGLNLGGNNANVCWQASFDTDNDGLLDVWEKFGVDTNNDGHHRSGPSSAQAPTRCARTSSSRPTTSRLRITLTVRGRTRSTGSCASFANAPISNPDRQRPACSSMSTSATCMAPEGSSRSSGPAARWGPMGTSAEATKSSRPGTRSSTLSSPRRDPASSSRIWKPPTTISTAGWSSRYAIFGHQTNARAAANDCTTGAIDPENRQFLLTLGGVDAAGQPCFGTEAGFSIGSSLEQSGTFMHDLGHVLNRLHHGGSEDVDRKPNYLSVMNFDFQMCGVPTSPGVLPGVCDYSRSVAKAIPPPLDERSLDECIGIAGGLGFGPVDWNRNGVLEGETRCGPVSFNSRADVNSDGICVSAGSNRCGQYDPRGRRPDFPRRVIDGRDRVCSTAAGPGTDDVQVTPVGQTPTQPDVLNSTDDWADVIFDPLFASRFGAPAVNLRPTRSRCWTRGSI